jgi:hypothetical protein
MTEIDPKAVRDMIPFAVMLGIEILQADADQVVGTLAYAPELATTGGSDERRRADVAR